MRLKDIAVTTGDLFRIDPSVIEIEEGFNVRIERPELAEHIKHLVASIRIHGVIEPLTVRLEEGRVFLVNGHNRLRAVKELISEGMDFSAGVPCISDSRTLTPEARKLRILLRNDGLPHSPLEKAMIFRDILATGMTVEEIAREVGYTTKQVHNLVTLAEAPEAVKEAVQEGAISATEAIKTVKKHGEQAPEVIQQAVGGSKNGHATAKTLAPTHVYTRKRIQEMRSTLEGILETEDVEVIHVMVRDCLAGLEG